MAMALDLAASPSLRPIMAAARLKPARIQLQGLDPDPVRDQRPQKMAFNTFT
jgi:hypothetical protein